MNYELALELKDKGFPQHENAPVFIDRDCHDSHCHADGCTYDACVPTLSELISECGDCIVLHHLHDLWAAGIGIKWSTFSSGIDTSLEYENEGSTPEEAVARLWLALQEK